MQLQRELGESSDQHAAKVAILMCTYRGERFLARQLETIARQTHLRWRLYVSDDGSDDRTLHILDEFAARFPQRVAPVLRGPQRGYAANFLSLVARCGLDADYYAFSDQDDEWQPDKLQRALAKLKRYPEDAPVLYASRVELVDAEGNHLGYSRAYRRRTSFANALVQCMINGNTMVLNQSAIALLRAAGTDVDVAAHDWWAYLLITGCGGALVFDQCSTTRYRQHGRNVIGSNHSVRAQLQRFSQLMAGDFRTWNDRNLLALRPRAALLHTDHRRILERFDRARDASCAKRVIGVLRSGVYRQTVCGQLGLAFAALTKRV
ncbi:MAG: glycosyltransferase family 2 protein [Polyangiales bacterium]